MLSFRCVSYNGFRFASRAALREAMRGPGVSRGTNVTEIQKRLADFEREQKTKPAPKSKYDVDSMMGEKLLQTDDSFNPVLKRRAEELLQQTEPSSSSMMSQSQLSFPLLGVKVNASAVGADFSTESCPDSKEDFGDRGFYVEAGQYVDEYIAGNTADIPDDEISAPTRIVFGADDAVEHIDFQLPGQSIHEDGHRGGSLDSSEEMEWSEQFGGTDPLRAASKKSCGGCGANLHCKDGSLPGFLPLEVFEKVEKKKHSNTLCKRCHLLKNHNFLLNVNVCPVDYEKMMSHLRMKEEALILMVVDVTDLPGSIHRHLPNIIGARKPMIVVGNKIDLLPPDARCGYLKRFRTEVQRAIDDAGFRDQFNVLHTALVSAKTGYGIEDLVTEIHLKYTNVKMGMRSDMYLVGCTNAGKSTLFNAFLQSDLCKIRAVDLVERATTSLWPGTTISLLKFPVMKPSPYRLEMRRRRLMLQRAWNQKEMYARKLLLQQTGDAQYAVLTGTIQNTYKDQEDDLQPVAIRDSIGAADDNEYERHEKDRSWDDEDPMFAKGTWCYDTPGTVNDQQVTSLFSLDELVRVLPRRLLIPRTAIVPVGHSLLIGGVGRIDVVGSAYEHAVYLTTFASNSLPLNCIPTSEVPSFYEKYLGSDALVVPSGDAERMRQWPGLADEPFRVRGMKEEVGCADLVLSSIGWVMVTSPDKDVRLTAWSPAGKGLAIRDCLLPFSASLRGKRIPGTQFYKTKPLNFPVNTKRQKTSKNKQSRNSYK